MSDVRSVLAQVKAKRLESERLDECLRTLRKPWYHSFRSTVALVIWLLIAVFAYDSKHPEFKWGWVFFSVLSLEEIIQQLRRRDRLWRQLIALRCPDLDRELRGDGKG